MKSLNVRERKWPNYPLLYKISAEEYVKDAIRGIDYFFSGRRRCRFNSGIRWDGEHTVAPTHYPYGNLVHLAEEIKNHVSIPIIAVGAINEPELAESILKEKKADFISMCRAITADPDWPKKAEGWQGRRNPTMHKVQ